MDALQIITIKEIRACHEHAPSNYNKKESEWVIEIKVGS